MVGTETYRELANVNGELHIPIETPSSDSSSNVAYRQNARETANQLQHKICGFVYIVTEQQKS